MADDPSMEAAKKQLEKDRVVSDKSKAEFAERTKGRPTPTQEENDLHALGAYFTEHSDDGSGPDPNNFSTKQLEGGKPATYQTRQATPAHTTARHSSS